MEQQPPPPQYWMWDGTTNNNNKKQRPQLTSIGNNSSPHHIYVQQTPVAAPPPSCSSYEDSWEEQAFAEDAAGVLGGCIWPPRSYSCTFCRREFRSAQALGGHMNVHRRDRARLKQSPISPTAADPPINHHHVPYLPTSGYQFQMNPCRQINPTTREFTCTDNNPNPSPDPPPSSLSPPRVSADNKNSCSEKSFFPSAAQEEQINRKRPYGSMSNSRPTAVGTVEGNYKKRNTCNNSRADLPAASLNLVLQRSSQLPTSASDDEEEAAMAVARFKRRRIEDHATSSSSMGLPFMLIRGLNSTPRCRPEVFETRKSNSNSNTPVASCLREDLDLELRLGVRPPPKVKSI